jgi:hypothetical protein
MNGKTAKKLRKEARKYQRDTFDQFDLAFKCLNSQRFLRRLGMACRLLVGKL